VGRTDLIGHTTALHPDLTLAENLHVVAHHVGADPDDAIAALDRVGLRAAAGRRAARCSAGMHRRAEFARLRLTQPDLLLLDEPDVALDDGARLLVEDAIIATLDRGGAVIAATHAPDRLEHLATVRWAVRDGTVTT
jgi:ABC-type transport system involved in cytochrome c biogenesis ATPase subunit